MVVFTCNHCGESLQKPRVVKHYQFQCRRPKSMTCVDCLVDFREEEYVSHTKCITENERYGGKDYVPKEHKGECKQQEWLDALHRLVDDNELPIKEKNFLQGLLKHENIPRKRNKFVNFVKNVMGFKVNMDLVSTLWYKIEAVQNKNKIQKPVDSQQDDTKSEEKSEDKILEIEGNIIKNDIPVLKKSKKKSKIIEQVETNDREESIENDNIEKSSKKSKKRKLESLQDANQKRGESEEMTEKLVENGNGIQKSKKRKSSEPTENQNGERTEPMENGKTKKCKKIEQVTDDSKTVEKKSKKNKSSNSETPENIKNDSANDNDSSIKKFKWKNSISNVLEKKREMSLKKLEKKVLSQYKLYNSVEELNDELVKKFHIKLNNMKSIKIINDKVLLI